MKYYSPAEGITRAVFPVTENKPEMPVLFGRESHAYLRLESCELTPRAVYRTMETGRGKPEETANGEVMAFSGKGRKKVRECRRAVLTFSCRNGQVITGLGQHERGILNYAREKEWLYAHNMKIPVPFVLGSDGWGLLADTECAAVFTGLGGGFRLELNAVDELSLTFIEGSDCGQVVRRLSRLAGLPAMLPKWAFGYIQSKERYRSAEELILTAREFRERKLSLDCIVLDWMSWKDGFWGDKTPDPERFPDIQALTDELHRMKVRLMVSVWPNMVRGRDLDEFSAIGGLLPGTQTYDAFSPVARDLYWQQAKRGWMNGGTDALWCDSCEPITDPDWCGAEKRSEEERMRLLTGEAELCMDPVRITAYGEEHTAGLDEHWRKEYPGKRTVILARSGGLRSAAHGTILWSGDISAKWNVLRAQVTDAIRSALSGLHYWTLDIGAFFVGKKDLWFWDGDYPEGVKDAGYRELYVRWFQFGALLPVFRSHGTETPREPWRFADREAELRSVIELRYRLLPYLYATAAQACRTGMPMLRGMMIACADDPETTEINDTFMLGDALLVKPVCKPVAEGGSRTEVRLPAGSRWYNWFTGTCSPGGVTVEEETPVSRFPLYIRAGAILPVATGSECAEDCPVPAEELLVYTGADGSFTLYDDAGDGNGWRQGEYLLIPLEYREAAGTLILGDKQGSLSADTAITVRFRFPDGSEKIRIVVYRGKKTSVSARS